VYAIASAKKEREKERRKNEEGGSQPYERGTDVLIASSSKLTKHPASEKDSDTNGDCSRDEED